MKILEFKGKISLRDKILIAIAIILIIAIVSVVITYVVNENVREWININILRKNITEDDVPEIIIDADKSKYIYAYDKYIVILCNGKLEIYNTYGNVINELEVAVSNPIFKKNGTYLAIAEKDGQKVLLISERKSTMGK